MISFIDLATQYRAMKAEVDTAIARVLDSGSFIMGPEVAELEQALADYAGTRHCIGVSSGTDALLMSLMALGIGPGDEIITTSFTFAATVEVIALVGATPVLVDIEPDTCNIDPAGIEAAITGKTRAIMPVSLYGQPADMDAIGAIASRHGLPVIEDAAQSFGATFGEKRSCALSMIGCTSFFPSKPLGCYGDGGAVFTDDDDLAATLREIRVHGQSKRYHHTRIGLAGRIDTIQCAVLLAKLKHFPQEVERRLELGERYNRLLDERGIARVAQKPGRTSVFAQFTVFTDERDVVIRSLTEAGIPTAIHYPSTMAAQPAYAGLCRSAPLPHAETAAARVLSLPMHPYLDHATQDRIVAALVEAHPARPAE